MLGPIFLRDWSVLPRKMSFFAQRLIFTGALFSLLCTGWLLIAGVQQVRNTGDIARFSSLVFQILVPLQMVVVMFLAALAGASSICNEKDRKTLILLLMTSLTNFEIVVGKVGAGLLTIVNLCVAALPLLLLFPLLGGVSPHQAIGVFVITLATALTCGSLGATLAFWREKTFQTLALASLAIVLWCLAWEAVATGLWPAIPPVWASYASPIRAVMSACQPIPDSNGLLGLPLNLWGFTGIAILISGLLLSLSIMRLRIWNPTREVRRTAPLPESSSDLTDSPAGKAAATWRVRKPRRMWSNPILWREVRTWAYGRKILVIRVAYLTLFIAACFAVNHTITTGSALQRSNYSEELLPAAAQPLAPLFVVSLVLINALAVNSITVERDGQALDLLLVTEISSWEFVGGKILGSLYVAKEMVLLPIAICVFMWWQGAMNLENLLFLVGGLIVMDLFVSMLGIHCGMMYSQSRSAIAISLGTVFFLFLGVVTCMLVMLSFRGSFGRQLAPFLVIILGGGTGLFTALGYRNPSPALALASFSLPFLTFFSITSFILRNQELTVFSVITVAYGFTTAAMMIPAISEFSFSMGRARTAEEDN